MYKDNNRISTDTMLSPATTRHNQPTCTNTTTTTTSATTANTQPCNSIHDKSTDMTQPTYRFADCGGIYNHNNTAFLSRYGHCLPSPQSLGPHPPVPACIPVKVYAAATERDEAAPARLHPTYTYYR
jgi:hypothetical protein